MYDFELPTGCLDADIEMAQLQAVANRESRLWKRGICAHGWLQGPPGPATAPTTVWTCLYCGKTWATEAECRAEREEILA